MSEVAPPTGQQFVDVGLVSRIPEKDVLGGVKHAMERQGEFDDSEVGTQMTAGRRHGRDNELANLLAEYV
jgi:hypothetical protein